MRIGLIKKPRRKLRSSVLLRSK